MTRPIRWKPVLLAAVPLLVPWTAYVLFAINCEDGWCEGGRIEAAAYALTFSAIVIGAAASLSTRPIHGVRVGVGAWSLAFGLLSLWIMASQLLEHDYMVAMVWGWLGATAIVAALVLAGGRNPREPSGQEPFPAR